MRAIAFLCLLSTFTVAQTLQPQTSPEPPPSSVATYSPGNCPKFVAPAGTLVIDGIPVETIIITGSRLPPSRSASPPLPEAQPQKQNSSVTKLALHLLVDGTVKSAQVIQTSGNTALDGVAQSCLTGRRLTPITSGGIAIEADTTASVGWPSAAVTILSQVSTQIAPSEGVHLGFYPPQAVRMNHQGYAVLSFLISADGTVKNIVVTKPSGFDSLDNASVLTASQLRYQPPVSQNGKPVSSDAKIVFVWRLN